MKRFLTLSALGMGSIYLLTGVAEIRPEERAVVRRFGAVVARPGPGLWIGLPWGIDRIDRVPLEAVQRVVIGYDPSSEPDRNTLPVGQLLTGDQNLVNVQAAVYFDVGADGLDDFVRERPRVEGLIARCAESILADWVAARSIDDVLLTGNAELPNWLSEQTQRAVKAYRLGVRIRQAGVMYLSPPDDVKADFDRVNQAQASIRTKEDRSRSDAIRRMSEAQTYRQRQLNVAESVAFETVQSARSEAETFTRRLEQYRRLRRDNPDVLVAMWWDEMGVVFRRLKENGRIDLLDNRIAGDGLDITQFAPPPKKK